MSAKISGAHRKAFLQALAETGDVTLAADRVRVSKDWAYKLRRRDAGFDAACRAAVAAAWERLVAKARERLRQQAGNSKEGRWIPDQVRDDEKGGVALCGHAVGTGRQLIVQRGNGRRVQVKRARPWNGATRRSRLDCFPRIKAGVAMTSENKKAPEQSGAFCRLYRRNQAMPPDPSCQQTITHW